MYRYRQVRMAYRHMTTLQRCRVAAAALLLLAVGAVAVLVTAPTASATPGESVSELQAEASRARREVARLDRQASVATEKYNAVRAELDAVNIRLFEARRDLSRAQNELDTAQELLGERIAEMYKSDDFTMLEVLFHLSDFSEVDTQLGYFESINEADLHTVGSIEEMEGRVAALTVGIEDDREVALEAEMTLREKQADIEDELARRRALLSDLDARVKKLIAQQERLDAAASRRLAKAAGVDLDTISGTPAQIAVLKETMKYLGIPYVWAGATPSGGFDCSGLVLYVYAKFGVDFPHGATMQAHMGDSVPFSKMQPADIVFFGNPSFYHHVGIYIGNGLFIEAPHTGDVVKVSRLAGRGCALACRYPIRLP
jgi:cell wall-associated NlpC family hydrolase